MQAGLSWITVLRKRDRFRAVCAQFDPVQVAQFTSADIERLANDAGIIRNRAKLRAMVHNATKFLELQAKHGSVDAFFWGYVDGTPVQSNLIHAQHMPTVTPLATQLAADLRRHGFTFVGATMCYALMQATGMVNDHVVGCFRHRELS